MVGQFKLVGNMLMDSRKTRFTDRNWGVYLFIYFARLSVDVSEDHISSDTDDDDSDEDYEPSINITLG